MRILFAGTPEFARQSLKALLKAGLEPRIVFTQPDRAAGRGKKLTQSPVKEYATEQGLTVRQPATLKEPAVASEIARLEPDVMVVSAYGLLLPELILELPRRGCVNVHASLLPRWRGAAPIQAAILAGDRETGISLMQMDAGLDTGAVYVQERLEILDTETAGELHDRLAMLGGEMLAAHLGQIVDGKLTAIAQDDALASYAPKIAVDDARLRWNESAGMLERKVRAYNPLPGCWFQNGAERVKCWQASWRDERSPATPGTVLDAGSQGVDIACGQGVLRLLEVQRAGRKRISGSEFSRQQPLTGTRFG